MASLYVIRGKDNGQHFLIRGAVATIGRESHNQIHLRDTEVSRQHAKIVKSDDGEHTILDEGSSNGTFVNSRRIEQQKLQSGDRVQVGRTLLIYTGGPEPHSTRSQEDVEIVSEYRGADLSHIKQSLESHHAGFALRARPQHSISPKDIRPSSVAKAESLPSQSPSNQPADIDGAAIENAKTLSSQIDRRSPVESSRIETPSSAVSGSDASQDWEIVYEVAQAISRTGDLDDLLSQVLELIFEWIACDRGCIMLLDDVTGQLTPSCSRDRKRSRSFSGQPTRRKLSISRTILDHVVETKEGVLTSNAQDDARWENVESIAIQGVHEAICVPMLGRYGLVGAIYVDTQSTAGAFAERKQQSCFEEQHLKLMVAIAGQAALAIEDTQFYRAMLQSERMATMGHTIANLSHHIKNILQGVRGGSYLIEDGLKKENLEVVRKGWSIVERNQERISNLVMDMLSFSKDREPVFARRDIREIVDDVVELMQSRAAEKDVLLEWPRPADAIDADYDFDAMHRAILNVVTNAIDAANQAQTSAVDAQAEDSASAPLLPPLMQARVTITAELSSKKNRVRINVQDNGEGVSESDVQRIFSPFESNKGSRGTGLGLPVSQKILREHGGDISVTSEPSQGAKFSLHWPAFQNSSSSQPSDEP